MGVNKTREYMNLVGGSSITAKTKIKSKVKSKKGKARESKVSTRGRARSSR